jgi:exodeoxyribonuclease V alpha subunit
MNAASNPPAESPAAQLAEGFAQHVEQWARDHQCDGDIVRVVRQAAFELSLATGEGHVCLSLADLGAASTPTPDIASLRQALLTSGMVGTPESPGALPMILDADDRLYLHRYFDYERRLARRLMRAVGTPPAAVDAATRARLNELFQANAARLGDGVDWQKVAAALALLRRLTIISGGPGTGKTTTVVNLLACLIEQNPDCRIALAAPTGKAAARMTEAIRQRAAHLPPALRERLPAESFTVHRLLGVTPGAGGFVHHAGNPLAIDALVVDEASMLDLALATKLFEAVPDTARIILLGDKDQLAAVESGAVFSELGADPTLRDDCRRDLAGLCGLDAARLLAPAPTRPTALHDAVVWFTQNFRFAADSGIGRFAADINGARATDALNWLRAGADDSVCWLDDAAAAPAAPTLQRLLGGFASYLETVRRDPADCAAITRAFGTFRVLCAVRDGPRGVNALNERVTRHAREVLASLPAVHGLDAASPWYPGRPVMVLRNDYVLKLFNGDIGIALPGADGALMVYFPDAVGGFRALPPLRLPLHQTAFAMTVHKSQGSEFDEVLVMLPDRHSRVVTRELLYTAVTRARERVAVCTSAEVLAATIQSPTRRHSGLLARLAEVDVEKWNLSG